MTPLLVEAVKTLKTKADEQQRQIDELQHEIEQLKELLSKCVILK